MNAPTSGSDNLRRTKSGQIGEEANMLRVKIEKYHDKPIYSIDWSENGKMICSGSMDKSVKVMPISKDEDGNIVYSQDETILLKGHKGMVRTVGLFFIKDRFVCGRAII
jgi:WD40 repeat protein